MEVDVLLMSWLLPIASAAELTAASIQYGVCISCHGTHGEGRPAMGGPRIGDLEADHISAQLHAFRDGGRGGHPDDVSGQPMRGIAGGLDDLFGFAAQEGRMRLKKK